MRSLQERREERQEELEALEGAYGLDVSQLKELSILQMTRKAYEQGGDEDDGE